MRPSSQQQKFFIFMIFILTAGIWVIDTDTTRVLAQVSERIQKIEKEIEDLEEGQQGIQGKREELEKRFNDLQEEREQKLEELMSIDLEMNRTAEDIAAKEKDIKKTKDQADVAEQELKEAEARVDERDDVLKTRVRAMYESGGNISYIEVLLGSASFGDFLQRLDYLSLILRQDQQLLQEFIADQQLIEQKKAEIDGLLASLETQLDELEGLQDRLQRQDQQKRVQIASVESEQQELEDLDEQMQEDMLRMANELSDLVAEKGEVQAQSSPSGGQFAWPVQGYTTVTSPFGMRIHPIYGTKRLHSGMDIGAPQGTPILAAESGVVTFVGTQGGYGNTVIIDHGNGFRTLYPHIRPGGFHVSTGQKVSRGQKIAEVGTTGTSTGPHLHFEVHKNGKQVNPAPYVQ